MSRAKYLQLLIVDEYPIIRWALREYLARKNSSFIIREAGNPDIAQDLIKEHVPDLIIMELYYPSLNDGRAIDFIAKHSLRTVAFTSKDTWSCVEAFLGVGGLGFVPKDGSFEDVDHAIEAALRNRQWISPQIRLVRQNPAPESSGIALSHRETEIVELIVNGLTSKQIAAQLCVSLNTVETHRRRIYRKLGVNNSAQLVKSFLDIELSRRIQTYTEDVD